MTPKKIEIEGRRWFQRTYGNTYHSVRVWVDGHCVLIAPMVYGYGSQYEWTARNWLRDHGYLPGVGDYANGSGEPLWAYCQRVGCEYLNDVTDVPRQRDLHRDAVSVPHRGRMVTESHGLCAEAGYCREHEVDPRVSSCGGRGWNK